MNKKKRIAILQRLQKNNFHTNIELNFSSPFELLIAVLLSAQSTDISVNKATSKLYLKANTPQKILELGFEGVKSYIKCIGLANRKTESILQICRILLEKYNGKIPENRAELEALPGIGRKTANVVLNIIFNWSTIPVDTHVFRVCNRTNFATGKNVKQIEKKLLRVVPKKFRNNLHHSFILHGRYTCVARKPRCQFCIIDDLCEFKKKIYS